MTKFLLDSGDPQEYKEITALAKEHHAEIWGATTNPTLIAKKLTGEKLSFDDAFFKLQKKIVEEILAIVPGAVSAEVYSDLNTQASSMIEQGTQIATWDPRVVVKLPTTFEGFKARTELRKKNICINNTLVFSQQQVFAIMLHEQLMLKEYGKSTSPWPCFISPFIGRLDDLGQDGLSMIEHSLEMVRKLFAPNVCWMLEASVRNVEQVKAGIDLGSELETIRTTVMRDWLMLKPDQQTSVNVIEYRSKLTPIPHWQPSQELLEIATIDGFMTALTNGQLDITHPLTTKGIEKFAADWATIIE